MVFPEGGVINFKIAEEMYLTPKVNICFCQNGGWSLVKVNVLGLFDPRSTKHKKLCFAGLSIYKKDKSELQCQTQKSYDMKSQGRRLTAAAANGPVVLEWHLTSAEGGKCQVFSVRQRTHCAFR